MNDNRINNIICSEVDTKGLELLNTRPSVGSLSETDQFSHDEMSRFRLYSKRIDKSTIKGNENFPGEMLKPNNENATLGNISDILVSYYNNVYEDERKTFRIPFENNSPDSIPISLKINKYCRCRIGSEIFGSIFSTKH